MFAFKKRIYFSLFLIEHEQKKQTWKLFQNKTINLDLFVKVKKIVI
jgi:hypothetical protein